MLWTHDLVKLHLLTMLLSDLLLKHSLQVFDEDPSASELLVVFTLLFVNGTDGVEAHYGLQL